MTTGILVVSGPPCSGKSSVARALAARPGSSATRHVPIEVDALFELLLPGSDRGRADRMLAYDAAHQLTRILVQRGSTVVLECTYARAEQRWSLLDAIDDLPEAPFWVVECWVSADDAVRRFRHRDEPTDLDEDLVRERAEHFPYLDQALRLKSAEATPQALAEQVATWLRTEPSPVQRETWAEAGRAWA